MKSTINQKAITAVILVSSLALMVSGCEKGDTEELSVTNETPIENERVVLPSDDFKEIEDTSTKEESNKQITVGNPKPVNVEAEVKTNDEIILTEFQKMEAEIESSNDITFKEKAKKTMVTAIDFLFYGQPIKGITLNEISTETKNKIMDITERIDTKIDSKWPGYKETISEATKKSYNFVKGKLKQGLTKLDSYIEEKIGTETYGQIKDKANEIKDNAKEVYEDVKGNVKEAASTGTQKIKDWYEKWRAN